MNIITRCPECRLFQKHENKICKCGTKITDKIYYVSYHEEKRLKRRKIGRSYKHACIALGKIEESILDASWDIKRQNHDLRSLIGWYLNLQEVRARKRYKEIKRNLEILFLRLPNIIGDGLTDAFLKDQVSRSKEVGTATMNRELSYLKTMFNIGVKYGEVFSNPLARIKLFPENNTRNVNLNPEDVKNIIRHCDPRIKGIIFTAFHALLRREEILIMEWDQVDFKNKVFRLSKTKNGEARNVPIHPEVETMLRTFTSRFKKSFVFEQVPVSTLSRLFKKACVDAGFPDLHIHDGRAFSTNQMRLNGNDREAIKGWAGWKSDSMFTRYTFVSPDEIKSIKWG